MRVYKRIRKSIWRKILRPIFLKWDSPCRYLVEKKIFPKIKNKRVLLVGCAEYAEHYPCLLEKNNRVYSIDIDPEAAKYGAKHHIVGDVCRINKYFKENTFDIILFGGIFGYGLNNVKDAEIAMKNCHYVLKRGGLMIIWWANTPKHNQIIPKKLNNFKLFRETSFAGVSSGLEVKKVRFEILTK